jgi:hypothetical protein
MIPGCGGTGTERRTSNGRRASQSWHWQNEVKTAKEQLDSYMRLRGDIVHRSRPQVSGTLSAHPVKKDDLKKVIGFLKNLVEATERAFDSTV